MAAVPVYSCGTAQLQGFLSPMRPPGLVSCVCYILLMTIVAVTLFTLLKDPEFSRKTTSSQGNTEATLMPLPRLNVKWAAAVHLKKRSPWRICPSETTTAGASETFQSAVGPFCFPASAITLPASDSIAKQFTLQAEQNSANWRLRLHRPWAV